MLSRKKCLSLLEEYPFIDAVASATPLLLLTAVVIFIGLFAFLDSCLCLGSSSCFVISSVLTVIWMIFSLVCLQISKKAEGGSIFDMDDDEKLPGKTMSEEEMDRGELAYLESVFSGSTKRERERQRDLVSRKWGLEKDRS